MRGIFLSGATMMLFISGLLATEVEVQTKPSPKPSPKSSAAQSPQVPSSPTPQASAQQSPAMVSPTPALELPQYRPVLLGIGANSVVNRINTQSLIKNGQKDAQIMFCCSVTKTGEIAETWTYRQTPGSKLLEQELIRCLDATAFIPAIYNRRLVHALFYGTITFKVVNGKPRLRIFANQEAEELKKESNFVGPQPFVGKDSKFEGLHYPADVISAPVSGIVDLAMKVDAVGNLKDLRVVSEEPPLLGFRRAAAEDFRVARFIPAFRDGKPVECSITLPVYYEP